MNTYGYVYQNPLYWVDPLGLGPWDKITKNNNPYNPYNLADAGYGPGLTQNGMPAMGRNTTRSYNDLKAEMDRIYYPQRLKPEQCPPKGAPKSGDKVYRVWGDGAGGNGRSWSRTDPSKVDNYRDAAGLPNQNSGRFVTEGTLINTKGVKQRDALPLHGNKGGLDELVVPNPTKQVQIDRVSGVNPEF